MYCSKSFTKLVIGSRVCCTCSPAWVNIKSAEEDPWKVWNHPSFQFLRKMSLERRTFCKEVCPAKVERVEMKQEEWHSPIMEQGPKEMVFVAGPEATTKRAIRFLEAFRHDVRRIVIAYGDDPLENPAFRFVLQNLQGNRFPEAKIRLLTKGLLISKCWKKMARIHDNIDTVSLTMMAASRKTFQSFNGDGSWNRFKKGLNLLKQSGKDLEFYFPVCRSNMEEMVNFVQLAQNHGAKKIKFAPISKADVDAEVFKDENVANPSHPDHERLVEITREVDENYIRVS